MNKNVGRAADVESGVGGKWFVLADVKGRELLFEGRKIHRLTNYTMERDLTKMREGSAKYRGIFDDIGTGDW